MVKAHRAPSAVFIVFFLVFHSLEIIFVVGVLAKEEPFLLFLCYRR